MMLRPSQSLGIKDGNETKILDLKWDKQRNTNVLKTLASIYDSLGFILPVLLIDKILF